MIKTEGIHFYINIANLCGMDGYILFLSLFGPNSFSTLNKKVYFFKRYYSAIRAHLSNILRRKPGSQALHIL